MTCAAEPVCIRCVRPGARAIPRTGAAGKAGALMAGPVRERVTLAGRAERAERARAARAFVSAILGPGHPCGDVAVLLVSEVFGNSVRHSGWALPGRRSRSGPGRRSCALRAVMRKAAGGFSSLRSSRLGGAVDGVAGGW